MQDRKTGYLSKSVILIAVISAILTNYSTKLWTSGGSVIRSDVKSYYSYLPATVIYKDLRLEFLEPGSDLYLKMSPITTSKGSFLIVTSCGMALLYAPFFFTAHAIALITSYQADGYSLPYEFALQLSALFYFLLGLVFTRKLLKHFFDEKITALTLLSIAIGTNLFYYTTLEAPLSHAFNFGLIALFAWLTLKWHEKPHIKNTLATGLLLGLITLVRPTNILVVLFFILWDIKNVNQLKQRILFFLRQYRQIIIMLICFLIIWIPQLAYWNLITGQWVFFSYGEKGAGFFFSNPQIFNILFSFKKGWFIYTPVMALAFAGIFFMPKRVPQAALPVTVYILAMVYVLSSWWNWWFGGGFGLRAFTDTYAIMAIPLAALIKTSFQKKYTAIPTMAIILTLIWYNTFQIRQYRQGAIHYSWMNKEAYKETFLKRKPTQRFWQVLTIPDQEKARKGIYVEKPFPYTREENKRTLRKEMMKHLKKQQTPMDSLKAISKTDKALDNNIKNYIQQNIDQYIYTHKKEEMRNIVAPLMKDSHYMSQIERRAKERGVSKDSILVLDGLYRYREGYW